MSGTSVFLHLRPAISSTFDLIVHSPVAHHCREPRREINVGLFCSTSAKGKASKVLLVLRNSMKTKQESVPAKEMQQKQEEEWLGLSFRPQNYIPGLVIGFILGWFVELTKPPKAPVRRRNLLPGKHKEVSSVSDGSEQELKMVLVVRQDLKMGPGKVASQCAHAAMGIYAELMRSDQCLLRQWEQCGQPKIVCMCKNQQEMNQLREAAESSGLPTFIVADAGRTQVAAGSRTVLAIGPGPKASVDLITGKLRLL